MTKSANLGEDEPHPMGFLMAVKQLTHSCTVDVVLRRHEPSKIKIHP